MLLLGPTQVIINAIAFANTARFSICHWTVQDWSVFVTSLFCLMVALKAGNENRNAMWKTYYMTQDSSKLIGSFCKQLGMYSTDFAEICVASLSGQAI